jgi:hypothetical protein
MGVSPSLMADLLLAQGETSKTRQVVRHAGITNQHMWAINSRGKSLRDRTDGSQTLIGQIDVSTIAEGTWYQDGQTLTGVRENYLSRFTMGWSQMAIDVTWFKSELVFNTDSRYTDDYVTSRYVDLAKEKKMRAQLKFAETIESALWATPDKATMEGAGATQSRPMSLMATYNDHFGTAATAGGINGNFYNPSTGAFTTVQGIDNTQSNALFWRQQFTTYNDTSALPTGASGNRNIIGALDELYETVKYVAPPSEAIPNGYEADMWETTQWPNMVCITSFEGKRILQNLARMQGDRWQDAGTSEISKGPGGALGMAPTFGGMEVFASKKFGAGTYYLSDYTSASPTLFDQFGGQGKGPRYLIVNMDTFKVMFHTDVYFQPAPVMNYEQQFYANTIWYDTYTQNMNTARHLGGIVCPGTSSGSGTSKTYTATSVYTG